MAQELLYLPSYKNVEALFSKIATARQPDAFTTLYLANTLGLKGSGDRALITMLKALGFLDQGGRPTAAYANLKNPKAAGVAIAQAVRTAYEPLFAANERVHDLPPGELNGLISQVAGSDSSTTTKISGTFRALVKLGDFSTQLPAPPREEVENSRDGDPDTEKRGHTKLSPEFHYNIQVHLPANATEETYLNIFNALRKAFK